MASKRIATSLLLRSSRATPITHSLPIQCIIKKTQPRIPLGIQFVQKRWNSKAADNKKAYEYSDIVQMTETPSNDRIIIDTREPHELAETGRIPTAINIPIVSKSDAFFITDEEFKDSFGFERPGKGKELVFYCKAGVRSRAAAGFAWEGGWRKVGEYGGSWVDWVGKGGRVER